MRYTDLQHTEAHHNEWLSSLGFYKEDLDILTTRLNEVAGKNTGEEAMKNVEHFENLLEIQRQNISKLEHRIRSNMHASAVEVKHHAGKVDETVAGEMKILEREMADFEKNISQLRKDFNLFLSEWM
ncbi:MAG TPA: hypothetical protein VHN59_14800 [Chitinophagaceae bacterium]|nr:hypothetical protein [Chitinophagaceae bacterium]